MGRTRPRQRRGGRIEALEEQLLDHERRLLQLERTFSRILAALLFIVAEIPVVLAALLRIWGAHGP